jgi:hypothetical protein
MKTKTCCTCKIQKPLEDFYIRKEKPISECKGCFRERRKAYYYKTS